MVRITLATILARKFVFSLDSAYNSTRCGLIRKQGLFNYRVLTVPLVSMTVAAQVIPNNAGARNVGNGQGLQFITGGCVADNDCDQPVACCANNGQGSGVCSAVAASLQNGKQGCGFADPNAADTIEEAQAQVERQGF
jgi:hypothetical protein